jgi:hypothetical protein
MFLTLVDGLHKAEEEKSRWESTTVSRQLQAVDCDIDGRIVMEEIALVRAQRGARCPYYLGIPIEVDNQAMIHTSF